jgi:hypothetical protein
MRREKNKLNHQVKGEHNLPRDDQREQDGPDNCRDEPCDLTAPHATPPAVPVLQEGTRLKAFRLEFTWRSDSLS